MAINNNKIGCYLLRSLKEKINIGTRKTITNWSNRASGNNRIATTSNDNRCRDAEETEDDFECIVNNRDQRNLFRSSAFVASIPHESYSEYIKFRQLQPAFHPEFLSNTLMSATLEPMDASPSRFPQRIDALNVQIQEFGTAVPFAKPAPRTAGEPQIAVKPLDVITRSYSTKTVEADPEKCKKLGKKKKECHKFRVDCEQAQSFKCGKKPVVRPCTKQESPYPSYSEACHEEWEQKPDECKMCPWPLNKHPTFRPPKKKYHTSARQGPAVTMASLRKNEECPPPPPPKEPCGWAKDANKKKNEKGERNEEKTKKSVSLNETIAHVAKERFDAGSSIINRCVARERPTAMTLLKTAFSYQMPNKFTKLKLPIAIRAKDDVDQELITLFSRSLGYLAPELIVKKKPCEKPPPKCPENKKKPKKDKKCIDNVLRDIIYAEDADNKEPCKKFPFPAPPKIQRKPDTNRCKAKKKRKIKDCPQEKRDDCERIVPIDVNAMLLNDAVLTKSGDDKDKNKCPKFDLGTCEDLPGTDDPCGLKKKGETRKCPADLTKKRRKFNPRKKKD